MTVLSTDGLRFEGTLFPDPDPDGTIFNQGSTTVRYALARSQITSISETRTDDATGSGTIVTVCLIWFGNNNVVVADSFDDLIALWTAP